MKSGLICTTVLAVALAACSSEPEVDHNAMGHDAGGMDQTKHAMGPLSDKAKKDKREAADLLAARFGVDVCRDADLLGSIRRTSPEEGETMMRAFKVPTACAQGTADTLKKLGFEELEAGLFTADAADEYAEQVSIKSVERDGEEAITLEWKATQR